MAWICRAPGCGANVGQGRFTRHCEKHHRALRRHGEALGNAFTKTELAPYWKRVKAKRKATKDAPFWAEVETRWLEMIHNIRGLANGKPGNGIATYVGWDRRAAQALCKVADAAEPKDVIEVVAAMWLANLEGPRRFISDRHFNFNLVRRVRSLGDTCNAQRWDHLQNRVRRLYHELSPKVVEAAARMILAAMGGAAVHVAQVVIEDEKHVRTKRKAYLATFDSIRGEA
jgi:hypothetical protein